MFASIAVVVLTILGIISLFAIIISIIATIRFIRYWTAKIKDIFYWVSSFGGLTDKFQEIRHGQYSIEVIYRRGDQILLHENCPVSPREAKKIRKSQRKILGDRL